MEIELDKIYAEEQPRKEFEDIGELSASILKNGLLEPLKVVKKGSRYKLIDGERRYRALKLISEKKAECIILDNKQDNPIVQLAFDVSKRRLKITEEANIFKKLIDEGMDIYELASRLGVKVTYITRRMKLFSLQSRTRELISEGLISSKVLEMDYPNFKQHENRILERIGKEKGKTKINEIIQEETEKEDKIVYHFNADLNKFSKLIKEFNFKIEDFKIEDFKIEDYMGENLLQTINKLDVLIEKINSLRKAENNLKDIKDKLGALRLKYGLGTIVDDKLIKELK